MNSCIIIGRNNSMVIPLLANRNLMPMPHWNTICREVVQNFRNVIRKHTIDLEGKKA